MALNGNSYLRNYKDAKNYSELFLSGSSVNVTNVSDGVATGYTLAKSSDIQNINNTLNNKANSSEVYKITETYNRSEIDNLISVIPDMTEKSISDHNNDDAAHSDIRESINTLNESKAPSGFGLGTTAKRLDDNSYLTEQLKLGKSGWFRGKGIMDAPNTILTDKGEIDGEARWCYFEIIADSSDYSTINAYDFSGNAWRAYYKEGTLSKWVGENIASYTNLSQVGLTDEKMLATEDDGAGNDISFNSNIHTIITACPSKAFVFLANSDASNFMTSLRARINHDVGTTFSTAALRCLITRFGGTGTPGKIEVIPDSSSYPYIYTAQFDTWDGNTRVRPFIMSYTEEGFATSSSVTALDEKVENHESALRDINAGIESKLDISETVRTATSNKILYLNNDAKLPASITGDADTLDGKHAEYFVSSEDFVNSISNINNTLGNKANSSEVYTINVANTTFAIKNHASTENIYGLSNANNYGHVKLSDATNSDSGVNSGIAATPKAIADAIKAHNNATENVHSGIVANLHSYIDDKIGELSSSGEANAGTVAAALETHKGNPAAHNIDQIQESITNIDSSISTINESLIGKADANSLAKVATSGSYNDLSDTPAIPTVPGYGTSATAVGATAAAGIASTVSRSDHTHSLSKNAVTTALGYTPPTSDTNTTYTFATGDSNGQIKVTPSGGSAQNVSVKGLGSAAYTASTAYAASSHTHTKNQIADFPTIPTVNNATLTIQKNGTNVATFTANSSTNATANITVPTGAAADKGVDTIISAASTSTNLPTSKAVADFVEGKGYKTTDNNTTYTFASGTTKGAFSVTPSGGSAQSVSIYGLSAVATSGNYNDLSNKPTPNDILAYSLNDAIVITSTEDSPADLNSYTAFGNYSSTGNVAKTLLNCPTIDGFILHVERNSNSSDGTKYCKQRLVCWKTQTEWWRTCANEKWTNWINAGAYAAENLLDNWYFLDPVNSRGQTTYAGGNVSIDRWYPSAVIQVDIIDNGVKFTNVGDKTGYVYQYSGKMYPNGDYTTSALVTDFVAGTGTASFCMYNSNSSLNSVNDKVKKISGIGLITISETVTTGNFHRVAIQIPVGGSITIAAIKLECGCNQTLAQMDANGNWVLQDAPPNKAMEELKCIQSNPTTNGTANANDNYAHHKVYSTLNKPTPNDILAYSLQEAIEIVSTNDNPVDLDTCTSFGNYYATSTSAKTLQNCPTSVAFVMHVERSSVSDSEKYCKQRIITYNSNAEWWRTRENGSWTSWARINATAALSAETIDSICTY